MNETPQAGIDLFNLLEKHTLLDAYPILRVGAAKRFLRAVERISPVRDLGTAAVAVATALTILQDQ